MKMHLKKVMCLLLSCILLAGMLPMSVLADTGNFTISMPADLEAKIGDIISVPVVVKHTAGVNQYNSFDMSFTYDPSVLELTSTAIASLSVTGGNGMVRVLGYGSDRPVGKAVVTVTFPAVRSGETTIQSV